MWFVTISLSKVNSSVEDFFCVCLSLPPANTCKKCPGGSVSMGRADVNVACDASMAMPCFYPLECWDLGTAMGQHSFCSHGATFLMPQHSTATPRNELSLRQHHLLPHVGRVLPSPCPLNPQAEGFFELSWRFQCQQERGKKKEKWATQFLQTALKISTLTALKISALYFWAAQELRSADKVARIREKQEKMLKCLGRGAWPRWEEAPRVAWLRWKRKISKGQEGGWMEVVGVEKNKSQQWQHTRKPFLSLNFNPLWNLPSGETLETPEVMSTAVGLAGACRRKYRSGESCSTWALLIYLSTSKQPVLQGSVQAGTWLAARLGRAGAGKANFATGWLSYNRSAQTHCLCRHSICRPAFFSLGSGFHQRENPNFTGWYQTSW